MPGKEPLKKKPRPRITNSITEVASTGCGNLYVTVTLDDGEPFEVFAVLGKAGNCHSSQSAALTRAITTGIRYGIPADEYVKQLRGIRCAKPGQLGSEGTSVLSCPDAIAQTLERVIKKEI